MAAFKSYSAFCHSSGKADGGLDTVVRFCLLVRTLVFGLGGGEIAVLKYCQQLTGLHSASTIHVKRFYRGNDFWRDGGLVLGEQYRLAADHLSNGLPFSLDSLDGDFRLGLLLPFWSSRLRAAAPTPTMTDIDSVLRRYGECPFKTLP